MKHPVVAYVIVINDTVITQKIIFLIIFIYEYHSYQRKSQKGSK